MKVQVTKTTKYGNTTVTELSTTEEVAKAIKPHHGTREVMKMHEALAKGKPYYFSMTYVNVEVKRAPGV